MDHFVFLFILVRAAGVIAADGMHGVSLMQTARLTGRRRASNKQRNKKPTAWNDNNDDEGWIATERQEEESEEQEEGNEESNEYVPPFLLTWEVPAALRASRGVSVLESHQRSKRWINVTAREARHMSGPLTVLLALQTCDGASALKPIVEKVRQRGQARIHLIGVQGNLEPRMAWKRLLVGPLTDRDRFIVDTFGLPRTPLAGVKVSFLFNGEYLSDDLSMAPKNHRMFAETFTSGVYHKKVKEVPDLAVTINPGFPFYLGNWWPTLRRLWHSQVPIVATGYGHSYRNGFAIPALYNLGYDAEENGMENQTLSMAQPHSDVDTGSLEEVQLEQKYQALQVELHETEAELEQLQRKRAAELIETDVKCADSKGFVGLPKKSATLCGDREGNALVMDWAGFAELVAVRNPFVFCNSPAEASITTNCQGSEVLSVFQPQKRMDRIRHQLSALNEVQNLKADGKRRKGEKRKRRDEEEEGDVPPSDLAHQIMRQSLTCDPTWKQHRVCIEKRLKSRRNTVLPRKDRAFVHDFLYKLDDACADELADEENQNNY